MKHLLKYSIFNDESVGAGVGIFTGGTFGALNPSKPLLLDAEEIDLPIAPLAPRIGAKVAKISSSE